MTTQNLPKGSASPSRTDIQSSPGVSLQVQVDSFREHFEKLGYAVTEFETHLEVKIGSYTFKVPKAQGCCGE